MSILKVQDLEISFPQQDFVAVKKISFELKQGETLAIVGESGSGKSISALALSGLLPPEARMSGTISLQKQADDAIELNKLSDKDWRNIRGKRISMVFQEPMSSLNPVMKIGEQLVESILSHQQSSREEAITTAIQWLGKVQLPSAVTAFHKYPHQLSGGQKQRVMIAMAMCHHPDILIADEPTTALDVTVQGEIIRLMKQLQEEHKTALIFITHDLGVAAGIADNIMVMYKGEIVEYGKTTTIIHSPKIDYTKDLINCRPTPDKKGFTLPTIGNREVYCNTAETIKDTITTPLLSIKDVSVVFPGKTRLFGKNDTDYTAVDNVSMNIAAGETVGLVGSSGCGKSTLSKAIMGLTPVQKGEILLGNMPLSHASKKDWKTARKQMQMIFQDPYSSLNPRMSVKDNIAEPILIHNGGKKAEIDLAIQKLLQLVELPTTAASKYPHQFSGGQRQRIGIARALALYPKLIICDESVSALDVSIQAQVLNLLKKLQQELSLTYLFISHDLEVVYYFCDRIIVMERGKFVEQGSAADIYFNPQHPSTKKLLAANKQFHS